MSLHGCEIQFKNAFQHTAITLQGAAQIFGTGEVRSFGDAVRHAIVADDGGMLDGQVGCLAVEFTFWISAGTKNAVHDFVGFANGATGIVDEQLLNGTPVGRTTVALLRGQATDLIAGYLLGPTAQFGLGTALPSFGFDDVVILRAKLRPQLFRF